MSCNTIALTPIENKLLGLTLSTNLSPQSGLDQQKPDLGQSELLSNDPLGNLFNSIVLKDLLSLDLHQHKSEDQKYLKHRYLVEAGDRLNLSCRQLTPPQYKSSDELETVLRSILAQLVYFYLDYSTRVLPIYAKLYDFTAEEFSAYSKTLVGENCSENLSIIGKKQMTKILQRNFSNTLDDSNQSKRSLDQYLPAIATSPFYPKFLELNDEKLMKIREREFYYAILMFKTACSYSGKLNQAKLLATQLKNPIIYDFLVDQYVGRKEKFIPQKNAFSHEQKEASSKVWCQQYVCRKMSNKVFDENVILSSGSQNLALDLHRNFCTEFKHGKRFSYNVIDPRLRELEQVMIDDGQAEMLAQYFISLITKIPALPLYIEKYDDILKLSEDRISEYFKNWAKMQLSSEAKDLYYEEPLSVELQELSSSVERTSFEQMLHFDFDVNMGEFDRSLLRAGKLKMSFDLSLNKSFLYHFKKEWDESLIKGEQYTDALLIRLEDQYANSIKDQSYKMLQLSWNDRLGRILSSALAQRLSKVDLNELKFQPNEKVQLKLNFYYAPFALKFLSSKK